MTPTDTSSPDIGSNWLQRQWNRVRSKRSEDVVIGQVGAAADHVVIGKNIIQIGSVHIPAGWPS
ncbi:MAG: hypothetical protein IPK16_05510 [Anaerolineales bacterium]|nr:hypothetical protein [Anaerolineales bacterium]